MATIVYFRNTTADISRGQGDADLAGTTRQWSPLALSTTRGAAATSQTRASVTGPTAGIEAGTTIEWISPPIDQDVTISGNVSAALWGLESSMTANMGIAVVIERLTSQGARASNIITLGNSVELGTAAGSDTPNGTPTSTNMLKGDRFRARVYFDDAPTTTMATGFTGTFRYDGPTGSADGDSFITFNETFGFQAWSTIGSALITQTTSDSTLGIQGTGGGSPEKVGQSFTLASGADIAAVTLYMKKNNSPTDNVVVDITSSTGGTSLGSATYAASSIPTTITPIQFVFGTPITLAAGTYYIEASRSGATSTVNYAQWYYKLGGSVYAGGGQYASTSGSWGFISNDDMAFIVYEAAVPGSTLYLTDTASAVATAAVDREAWTSRGAGVQTDATNDAAGPTAPIQVSDTLGGTVVDWWTKPLTAFTLDGLISCNIRALETNAGSNAAVRCEIAVTAGDGTGATVWGAATDNAELGTSESAMTFLVAGDTTSVTDGQRLRIRLSFDDAPGVAMANAGDLTLYYAGTTAAASGDTYITLQQTLTEATSGTTVSVTPGAVTFAGQSVLLRTNLVVTAGAVTLAGQTVNTSVATVVGVTPAAVTITGQAVALKTTLAVTAGAVTTTGQTVNVVLGTVVPVTAGAITVTGQTVGLVRSIPATPGAVTLAGATVTPTSIIPVTPGAITFAGQTVTPGTTSGGTTVSVTPAAVVLAGQTVNTTLTTTVPATPGAVTLTGQTVLLLQSQVVTVGAVTISGQSVLLRTNLVVTPAAVSITGQTVNLATAIVVAVTPAAVTVSGQTITPTQAQPVTAGAVTLAGQAVALKNTVAVTPAAITLTGQTINTLLTTAVPVTPAAVVLTGQAINLTNTVAVTPAAVSITGQAVGITGAVNVTATPGAVTLTGQSVLLRTNLVVTPGAVTLQGQTVNTGGVVSVPVTTPGAVTFAGQTVNLLQSQAITAGAVTIAGQSVLLRTNLVVTPGAVTLTGQTVNTLLASVVPVTPAAVSISGQAILLTQSQAVTAGAVAIAGQPVGLTGAVNVTATPAAVVLAGQTVNLKTNLVVTPGAVALQGQTVNTGTVTTVSVTPAAVALSGQTVLFRASQALTAGQITVSGQSVGLVRSIPVTPAALSLAGQAVGMRLLVSLEPGTITIRGLDVHLGIPEEYTIALQAVWRPTLVLGGRHAPTVASRGAHRPTLVRAGVHVPTLTKAGASSP